jgi:hypothetical protein
MVKVEYPAYRKPQKITNNKRRFNIGKEIASIKKILQMFCKNQKFLKEKGKEINKYKK